MKSLRVCELLVEWYSGNASPQRVEPVVQLAREALDEAKAETEITDAERREFEAAEWLSFECETGRGFWVNEPGGHVVATKTAIHGWWEVSRYRNGIQDNHQPTLETVAEVIRWVAEPNSVECGCSFCQGDGPGIVGWERRTTPSYHCGD